MTPQKCEQIREKVLKLLNAPIVEVLEKENYTIQKHLGKIIEGVDANEIKTHFEPGIKISSGKGKEKKYEFHDGSWHYSDPLIAWGIRLGYLKELSAIMGLYPKNGNGDKEVKPLVVVNLQVNQGEKQSQGQQKSRK